jgi:two-component system, chemotaxis family, protein-glutamate methylesterase/glutaminase
VKSNHMIRLLIADDSATVRAVLKHIFGSDPEIEVVGEATDGLEAVEMTRRLRPCLVTMDIRMPRMGGFEATKQIMTEMPTPIVIVSGDVVLEEVEVSMHALRAGALTVLRKPHGPGSATFERESRLFVSTVKAMSEVKLVRHRLESPEITATARTIAQADDNRRARVVAIAASTGGPAALQRLLSEIPGGFPLPILVVQHIATGFVAGLAGWLNTVTSLRVKVAEDGERMAPSTVYIAPDRSHLGVSPGARIMLSSAPAIGGFQPSATFLFDSVAAAFHSSAVAVILTGMGRDGTEGLRAVRNNNGRVVAQDKASSVVFGMPGAAIEAGLAEAILPLASIAPRLVELASRT